MSVPQRFYSVVVVLGSILSIWACPALGRAPKVETMMFELGSGVHADSVALDSGDRLWFVGGPSERTAVVGRVEPDGSIVEIPIPESTRSSPAMSIVSGPDGAMWFSDPLTFALGRVSALGELVMHKLPRGDSPGELAFGPDAALWFTIPNKDRIGRMTMAGELTEFKVAPHSGLSDIAAGPDGNLWVTLQQKSKIMRIAPTGQRRVFVLPRQTAPESIVGGPGGLWFSEGIWGARRGRNRLGLITTAGKVTQFKVPAKFGTREIAVGPDGRIWFTTGPVGGAIGWMWPNGELGPRGCLDENCWLPVSSMTVTSNGILWFGTEPATCGICGGGSGQILGMEAGWVGHLGADATGQG
jgi:virginiamycin B lyase